MNVLNIHERVLDAAPEQVGALLDSLASPADRLWAWHTWPRMAFDRPLAVGADGGHGPIRYIVVAYTPGRSIRFRFTGPAGFDGWHGFEVIQDGAQTLLRHTVKMRTHGRALLTWPLVYRPMHDALLEDTLTVAQASPGLTPVIAPWSARVKLLRWLVTGGKARKQSIRRES
ncbi:MAG: SRPBCC family protein [Gammaproteobacteria bacterium]